MSDDIQSDANESVEISSESPESTQAEPSQESSESNVEASKAPAPVPFHEDPKIQEYITRQTQKQVEEARKSYDRQFHELRSQYEQLSKSRTEPKGPDKLLERLKTIDPEFGDRMAELDSLRALKGEVEELRQWKQTAAQTQAYEKAMTEIRTLHSSNQVPEQLRPMYEAQIAQIAASNPQLTANDVSTVYNQVHNQFKEVLTAIRRMERESYVTEKKEVAGKPTTQPKGTPVKHSKEPEWGKTQEERRTQLIQRTLKVARAEEDV